MGGRVEHLFICLVHRTPMKRLEEVQAIADKGLEGCAHAFAGTPRQVLLMDRETLDELNLPPGVLKENIVTSGLAVQKLSRGQLLRIGEALLEVAQPCAPCKLMDDIRRGLQQELRGRRGMFCRVIEGGWIRRGDAIDVVQGDSTAVADLSSPTAVRAGALETET